MACTYIDSQGLLVDQHYHQVHVIGALPLRSISRLWGTLNSVTLPVFIRPYSFRLYSFIFGCNLDEIEPADLREYKSLGEFFYRGLKKGARPVDDAVLVSPADGKVLHFGTIKDLRVEQVKGITYSLDALLGVDRQHLHLGTPTSTVVERYPDMPIVDDHEFAVVNGIEYTLDQLIGASTPGSSTPSSSSSSGTTVSPMTPDATDAPKKYGEQVDASVVEPERDLQETLVHDASVALGMGVKASTSTPRRRSVSGISSTKPGNSLFFTVIYLAPGDYHRFHSPTAWVVEKRRHFVGQSFNVYLHFSGVTDSFVQANYSPYLPIWQND